MGHIKKWRQFSYRTQDNIKEYYRFKAYKKKIKIKEKWKDENI